jgi:hypothetical protein
MAESMIESEYMRRLLARSATELPSVRLFRRNVGAIKMPSRRVFRFGIPGQCDLYGYERGSGRALEIELKNVRGRLTPAQERWRDWCREWGVTWILCEVRDRDSSPDETVTRWLWEIKAAMMR